MTRKVARSADRASFGTTGMPEVLRSQPYGFRGIPPFAIIHAVLEFIWGTSAKGGMWWRWGGDA